MKLTSFDYRLPKKLIAQRPISPRDHSRLLVFTRKAGKISHHKFFEIEKFLKPSDVIVMNDSKVIPARLWGKKETGGKIEVFLLKRISEKVWEVLIGGKGRRESLEIEFKRGLKGEIIKELPRGIWQVRFNLSGRKFQNVIERIGEAPTPPYIKEKSNLKKYQTVYAEKEGSVAAPTAGFHFTKRLINNLQNKGIQFEFVTLYVGFGTFEPVRVSDIEKHKIHPEFVEAKKGVIKRLIKAKKERRRIIAVGTTSVRVLETIMGSRRASARRNKKVGAASLAESRRGGPIYPPGFKDWINLFIYPGYKFKFVDALITNFHLPKSTLLMLVSAFAGRNKILKAYQIAKKKKYRFYSFGDAMFIK